MKTHYNPFYNHYDDENDYIEYYACGTLVPMEYYSETNDIKNVTCKKCLKIEVHLNNEKEAVIQHSCDDMGGYVEFMQEERFECCDTKYSYVTAKWNENDGDYDCPKCLNKLKN